MIKTLATFLGISLLIFSGTANAAFPTSVNDQVTDGVDENPEKPRPDTAPVDKR